MDFINHDKKFIFIHVPKTGGSSIQESFIDWNIDGENFEMMIAPAISNWKGWDQYQYANYRVFSFCRDPYDRFYSAYNYHLKRDHLTGETEFDKFVDFVLELNCGYNPNIMWHTCRTQKLLTHRGDENMVTDQFRFESFDDGYRKICDYLEMPYKPARKDNVGGGMRSYRGKFNSRQALMVEKHFMEDFVTFGYDSSLSEMINNECDRV